MKTAAIFSIAPFCLTYLSFLGYIFGYFVLPPALRKKLQEKHEKEGTLVFDNFLYSASALKELNRGSKDPAVLSLLRCIQISDYAFAVNVIL